MAQIKEKTMTDTEELYGINIFFLTKGLLKIRKEDLPAGFFGWAKENQKQWVQAWWDLQIDRFGRMRQLILDGLHNCDHEDENIDCIEVDGVLNGHDYPYIATTPAWDAYWKLNSNQELKVNK